MTHFLPRAVPAIATATAVVAVADAVAGGIKGKAPIAGFAARDPLPTATGGGWTEHQTHNGNRYRPRLEAFRELRLAESATALPDSLDSHREGWQEAPSEEVAGAAAL